MIYLFIVTIVYGCLILWIIDEFTKAIEIDKNGEIVKEKEKNDKL